MYSRAGAMVECSKLHGPCAVLIGDAAHGVTPSLGQGTNAALESALIFSKVGCSICMSELFSMHAIRCQGLGFRKPKP